MIHTFRAKTRSIVFITVISFVFIIFGLIGQKFYLIYDIYFGTPKTYYFIDADLSDLSDNTLSHYYVHARGKNVLAVEQGLYSNPPFDSAGIPVVEYKNIHQKHLNAVTISQYALENYELFLVTGKQEYIDIFMKQANWLMDNLKEGKWHYWFESEKRGLKKPWISAMAQGQGISVLLRAYQSTGNREYLNIAEKAFKILKIPVKQDGVAYYKYYGTFFEEYPSISDPSHVMNGHIFTLFGIWDMYRVTMNPDTFKLFNDGVAAMKSDLSKYDTGYWVLYDQKFGTLISSEYMHLEIEQLKVLYEITQDPTFSAYAKKWDKYRQDRKISFCKITSALLQNKFKHLL